MEREVTYSREATKTLSRMPGNFARTIVAKVAQYAADPAALANNVKALKGTDLLRLRVGDYRVIMTADTLTVLVIKVGVRGDIYD